MSDNDGASRITLKAFLQELATYVSLLSPLIGPPLAWFGVGIEDKNLAWLLYVGLLPIIGISWLIYQYKRAKDRIEEEGIVQRPTWLWTLLTNRITHRSQQLQDMQVMVMVPPSKEDDADNLSTVYNQANRYSLLFHHIPQPVGGKLDEDLATVRPGGAIRSLKDLSRQLDDCAAIVLLDDCHWGKYVRTMDVVQKWSIKHTVRPIMSIRLEGLGNLNYSWCLLSDATVDGQALPNRLLVQAANRAAEWHQQSRLNRRLALWLAAVSFIILLGATAAVYITWRRADILSRAIRIEPTEQLEIAWSSKVFRDNSQPANGDLFKLLLEINAKQLAGKLARASGLSDPSSLSVVMLAVGESPREPQSMPLKVQEVAATRAHVSIPFEVDLNGHEMKGIASCVVAKQAFVLWTGDSSGTTVTTSNIQAWDLQGRSIGKYSNGAILFDDNKTCSYYTKPVQSPPDKPDDPRQQLLCGPVGLADNSQARPTGVICVSSTNTLDSLTESWVRYSILHAGNSLSFAPWHIALPVPQAQ